ncbi:MAG: glycosyltransferase family 2 protein [Chitinophagales bacterium]
MFKYSIIIAVYNRLDEVKELLKSAEELQFERNMFELLFVDDGSNDGFKEFIESYQSKSGLHVRAIYQTNKGPGAARNNGMSQSASQYFILWIPIAYLRLIISKKLISCGNAKIGRLGNSMVPIPIFRLWLKL